jgi:hypothetical protein
MQVALDDENVSPLDATLESVMPGVHQRFVALEGHVKKQEREMIVRLDKLDTSIEKGFTDLQETNRGRDTLLAHHLMMMAGGLVSPASPTAQQQPPETNRWPPTSPPRRLLAPSPSLAGDGGSRHHRMVLKHHSIQSLWNEWYGLEDCEDKPVVGGIAAIERHQKSKWRKHFSPSEKKHFSRSQIVIRSIHTASEATDETLVRTIEEFEDVYLVRAKKSMATMATIVQELGLVTKKRARGKRKRPD